MGDPRRLKKHYKAPRRLFDKFRIKEEKRLKAIYGLKNMRSLWRAKEELRKIRREARKSLALPEEEKAKIIEKIAKKLQRLNIAQSISSVDDILSLDVRNILERRLQTIVYRKGMAKTIKQARQLITHGFIAIGDKVVKTPGYLVSKDEEDKIRYAKDVSHIFKENQEIKQELGGANG
jgi:small subunit ribosomal protein S4